MGVKDKSDQDRRVDAAIHGLYSRFPDLSNRHACSNLKTKEIKVLTKKIAARRKILDNDTELKKLESELKDKRCAVIKSAKEQHQRVDVMLRKFQTRGVTDELLDQIDEMSVEKPAYDELCECDEDEE